MNFKRKTVVGFSVLIFLILCVMVSVYFIVGSGSKEIRSAQKFMKHLKNENLISGDINDWNYKSTKKTDAVKMQEYYNVTVGDYGINVDSNYDVIGFTNLNSKVNEAKIDEDTAKEFAQEYILKICDDSYKFKEILKEEQGKNSPYYTVVFTKYESGYSIYSYDVSININKETGELSGYSNSLKNKEVQNISVNITDSEAEKTALSDFAKSNFNGKVCSETYKAFYDRGNKEKLELCYIVTIEGNDSNNNKNKIRYFISTETGEINNTEKTKVTSTEA